MKRDYTKFDALLTSLISHGVRKFSQLEAYDKLKTMAVELNGGDLAAFRVIDRRLQALRKRGVIRHDARDGWVIDQR